VNLQVDCLQQPTKYWQQQSRCLSVKKCNNFWSWKVILLQVWDWKDEHSWFGSHKKICVGYKLFNYSELVVWVWNKYFYITKWCFQQNFYGFAWFFVWSIEKFVQAFVPLKSVEQKFVYIIDDSGW